MALKVTRREADAYLKLPGLDPGKQSRAADCPTEDWEQEKLFERIFSQQKEYWELSLCFHVPNGGYRRPREAWKFERLGVRPGVPDVVCPVPAHGFHGLWIEMKRRRRGHVEDSQREWHDCLRLLGYRVVVTKGWEPAWAELVWYLGLPERLLAC